jgi:hypothetical protein
MASLVPASGVHAARDKAPGFLEQTLDLPGMPAAVIPADMNADGIDDLVILVAYTTWDSVSQTERVTFDDIEGLVEVMSVVSSLLDRREVRVYPGLAAGGFGEHLPPLELDASIHALESSGQPGTLVAATDDGVSTLQLTNTADGPRLRLEPVLDLETSFTGSGAFYADVRLLHDLNGDRLPEIVLPIEIGWSVHRGTSTGFSAEPLTVLQRPEPKEHEDDDESDPDPTDDEGADDDSTDADSEGDSEGGEEIHIGDSDKEDRSRRPAIRIPEARDVNGDRRPDLVLLGGDRGVGPLVYLNLGDSVAPALELELEENAGHDEEITFVGDLDGDGRAELVTQEEIEPDDENSGFKKELQHAKRPPFTYRLYRLGPALSIASEPYRTFRAIGYTFQGSDDHNDEVDVRLPGGFQDLDGDGREDLVAITLDFSLVPLIFQALAFRRISLRMDFHPWCQEDDGSFSEVLGLDLSGKFTIKFKNTQIKHLSQFAGDFNGDNRRDFVQLGRGKKVTIHQGGAGCTYPVSPDRKLQFAREPKHLGLVRILDLDGNGRSDIYVVHPLKDPDTGESIPVRVDLYLSENGESCAFGLRLEDDLEALADRVPEHGPLWGACLAMGPAKRPGLRPGDERFPRLPGRVRCVQRRLLVTRPPQQMELPKPRDLIEVRLTLPPDLLERHLASQRDPKPIHRNVHDLPSTVRADKSRPTTDDRRPLPALTDSPPPA